MTWTIDPSHSSIGFSARHLMFTKVRGTFATFSGEVELDPTAPEKGSATFVVEAASVATRDEKRDAHLRSADFFDAEKHPRITFASTRVTSKGDTRYAVRGDLTIRGTSKPVVLDVELAGVQKSPWGTNVAGLTATASIDRRDWGLVWNVPLESGGLLVSEKVDLDIELQLVEQTVPARAAA
mgnify:CR=1 FL=1